MAAGSALLGIAEELYALPLPEFTPARDARVKQLKGDDADLARRVKALRKPSLAAWVVNLLVRADAEQVDQVLTLGAALREAQATLAGDQLRQLTRQRRQLTAAVTTQARAIARDRGQRVTDAVAEQVEGTLTAAMVDEGCAAALRSGLLVTALSSTGVESADLHDAVAVPEAIGHRATPVPEGDDEPASRPDLHVVPDPDAERKAREAAQALLDEADESLAEARQAQADAVADVQRLEARAMQVQAEIDEARARLAELEERYEQVDDELGDAEDVRAEADDALADAQRAHDEAAAALARLDPPAP